MKIVVLIKNVPDTEAKIKPTPDRTKIDTQGIKWVMNTFDEYAVEAALQLKEKFKDGSTVTVVSLGPDRVVETLRTALAMGADEAVHVWDPRVRGRATCSTPRRSSRRSSRLSGSTSSSAESRGSTTTRRRRAPPSPSTSGIPQVQIVTKFEMSDDRTTIVARRRIEGGDEVVEIKLPAVVTCEKGLNEPRYASLPGIMKAKKKEIKKVALADLGGLTARRSGSRGFRRRRSSATRRSPNARRAG